MVFDKMMGTSPPHAKAAIPFLSIAALEDLADYRALGCFRAAPGIMAGASHVLCFDGENCALYEAGEARAGNREPREIREPDRPWMRTFFSGVWHRLTS